MNSYGTLVAFVLCVPSRMTTTAFAPIVVKPSAMAVPISRRNLSIFSNIGEQESGSLARESGQQDYLKTNSNKMSHNKKIRVKRFTEIPITLFRIEKQLPVRLQDYATQISLGQQSYDFKTLPDGRIHPAVGDTYTGPNGMSLKPGNVNMLAIAKSFQGEATVYRLQEGLQLPSGLVPLLEQSYGQFSLQVDEPTNVEVFHEKLTNLLSTCPTQTLDQFIAEMEDEDDYDN